ncbi:amidohydrolase family protein [Roseibium salinum]|nr:amidohydrolase family protein [Roseibium salinum]
MPRSMLDSAFMIAADEAFTADLAEAVRMVTKTPAEVAGLADRGEIAEGKRADLLQVGLFNGHPFVKRAWRAGQRVL